ncbi:MAG: phosphohistidine phosphatase SixA [Proteobacteria bacterium]|nr:MAG: phosphohistidine phosphatase SixA [Pseudomonadota bacterium]
MDLYVIRHADAVPLGERGITEDADRPLSEAGEKQARALGKGLAKRGIVFDKVATSPYPRARQTAELMLKAWTPEPELVTCDDLVPDGKPKGVGRFLRGLKGERIAVVGHMPQLGDLTAWIIGGKKARIDLAKAGVAHVYSSEEVRKGSGTLVWLVTSEWFE